MWAPLILRRRLEVFSGRHHVLGRRFWPDGEIAAAAVVGRPDQFVRGGRVAAGGGVAGGRCYEVAFFGVCTD